MKMKYFVCPSCKGRHNLEEVIVDATVYNEVKWLDKEGLCYGPVGNIKGGTILQYQCAGCGYVLRGINTPEDLQKYLEENGKG